MKSTIKISEIQERIEASYKLNSAWSRGVLQYAKDLLAEISDYNGNGEFNAENIYKNGYIGAMLMNTLPFEAWKGYSWGGCSLVFNKDIAERLCTPSELKKTDYGMKRLNSREDWYDVQGKALFQAAELIKKAVRDAANPA